MKTLEYFSCGESLAAQMHFEPNQERKCNIVTTEVCFRLKQTINRSEIPEIPIPCFSGAVEELVACHKVALQEQLERSRALEQREKELKQEVPCTWYLLQKNCNANVLFLFVLRQGLCERLSVCSQKRWN